MPRRFLELRWVPQLLMDGTKILSMSVENLHFLDSLNFMPISLKSMHKSSDITCNTGYYFFNTASNLDYVGSYPETKYYGADLRQDMSEPNFWYGTRSKKKKFPQ